MSEVLVVTSKVKKLIKEKAGFNTSSDSITVLTRIINEQVDEAIKSATKEGRKTVMGRDFAQSLLTTQSSSEF